MLSGATTRNLAAVVLAFAILAAGIGGVMRLAVDELLNWDAAAMAESWARYVAQNVTDIEAIAAGGTPSEESMRFFSGTQAARNVFGFEVFDLNGNRRLASDGVRITMTAGASRDPTAARTAADGRPIVAVKRGQPPIRPSDYSEAYVPVMVDGEPRAIVAAFIDLSTRTRHFERTFALGAVALCLITGLAFGVPTWAWYRRTKEKQQADDRIVFLAHHDPLTGLYNRSAFAHRLEQALEANNAGADMALYYLDLDRFKAVNDRYNHEGGDRLIATTGERIVSVLGTRGFAARLGGDEFAILQLGIRDRAEAESFAGRLLASMSSPFLLNGHQVCATASIGVALAPHDATEAQRLLNSADLALYKAKDEGRNCVRFFTPDLDLELQARLALEHALQSAMTDYAFELHFQPLYRMPESRLAGYEALLRMYQPDGSLAFPAQFIPIAEEMGLIGPIGAWVIETACATAVTWPEELTVAVNLSPAQFRQGSVFDVVKNALTSSGLAAHRLQLEITEGLLLHDTDSILDELRRIKGLGVAIVMDDFGTGYSSLSYLWRFPFDKLKIDASFMMAMKQHDETIETVVKTIVSLGHLLQMKVTIEGVENEWQVGFVREVACDEVQGFYYGRPSSAAKVAMEIMRDFARAAPAARDGTRDRIAAAG